MQKSKELTQKQQLIKELYYEKNQTMEQIALSLGISKMGVCKHIKIIRQKQGILKNKKSFIFNRFTFKDSGYHNPPKDFNIIPTDSDKIQTSKISSHIYVRIHGLHFVVTPYHTSDFYKQKLITKDNVIPFFHGWRIELNSKNIEIISLEDTHFIGETRYQALNNTFLSFNDCLRKLENRLRIGLVKNDYMNVRMVKMHIAVVRDGIATSIDSDKVIILKNKEGEAWFSWDMSKDEPEWEVIHSITAKIDHDIVQRYIGDWKENEPPTNTELLRLIAAPFVQQQQNMAALQETRMIFKSDYIG